MEQAAIYARFSSDKQTEASIEAQERACREYAATHGIAIVAIYADEAISGKTSARRQYQKMLRDAQKGQFDTILIHQYDRIARNLSEHVNLETKLEKWGVALIAVAQDFGQSKEAKIMRALMWSLSEYYLDNLSFEVKKGHREKALQGLHNGGVAPFGYDVVNQRYIINELEAGFVRRIFDAAQHRRGFTQIIEEMAACGIRGKRGAPIRYTQIYEMLRNEKYTGVYLYSPEEEKNRADRREKPHAIRIENALPAIISKAQFDEVQKIMEERKQVGRKADYLCSGLVFCRCGAKMHVATSSGKGHTYHYYRCSARCGAPSVRVEEVDKAAREYLQELLRDETQQIIAQELRNYQAGDGSRMEEFRAALAARVKEKRAQYDALMQNIATAALPPEILVDIGQKMQDIKAEISALEATEPPTDFTVETVREWLEKLKSSPDADAIHLLVERIDIKNKTEFKITSTLNSILRKHGCGSSQHRLPQILFWYFHHTNE